MAQPTSGNDYLIAVDTNDADSSGDARSYVTVGGQLNVEDGLNLGTADATDKDSSNWEESVATNRSAEFSVECVREEGDTGQDKVLSVIKNRRKHYFRLTTAAGTIKEFQAFVTEAPQSAPQDDVATLNFTLKVTGAITES